MCALSQIVTNGMLRMIMTEVYDCFIFVKVLELTTRKRNTCTSNPHTNTYINTSYEKKDRGESMKYCCHLVLGVNICVVRHQQLCHHEIPKSCCNDQRCISFLSNRKAWKCLQYPTKNTMVHFVEGFTAYNYITSHYDLAYTKTTMHSWSGVR